MPGGWQVGQAVFECVVIGLCLDLSSNACFSETIKQEKADCIYIHQIAN